MLILSRPAVSAFLTICLCASGVGLLQYPRLQQLIASKKSVDMAILEKELKTEKIRIDLMKQTPSFGYDNVIANWVYLIFLQYFGDDEIRAKTGYSLSPEYFEVILSRDPRFLQAYLSLSTSASMYAGMPENSVTLMQKGLQSLSPWIPKKSYYIWRYKGIDELLFLSNSQAARQSFEEAANWAGNYVDDESKKVAQISRQTATFLQNNSASKYAQISTWTMVLNNPVDDKTRERAIRAIEALGAQVIKNPDGSIRIRLPEQD